MRIFRGTFLFLLLISVNVSAATISGTAYDGLLLEPLEKALISINTHPMQTKLSPDGKYSFDVPNGTYTLTATYSENGIITLSAEQDAVVTQEGEFVIDLILFPDFGEVPDEPLPDEEANPTIWDQVIHGPLTWLIALGIVLIAIGYSILHVRSTTRRENETRKEDEKTSPIHHEIKHEGEIHLDEYAMEILGHLKRGGNRLTQKDIRGMVNIGEAKVSLVISELESYGFVKKIKRGRGNILILHDAGKEYYDQNKKEKNNEHSLMEKQPLNEEKKNEGDEKSPMNE